MSKTILVCCGTGCLANGSKKVAEAFRELLAGTDHPVECVVKETGCNGFCENGPLVQILPDDITYYKVQVKDVEEIVDKTSGYPTASLVFPARIMKELPDYYLECPVGDIPMQLMMAQEGYGWYIDRDMSIYRVGVSSSWTTLMKQGDYEKKQRRYCEEMKRMYEAFDRESGGRFHKQAVRAARARAAVRVKPNSLVRIFFFICVISLKWVWCCAFCL